MKSKSNKIAGLWPRARKVLVRPVASSAIASLCLTGLLGCAKQKELPTVTSAEADFEHEHKHHHGSGQVHDHSHEGFDGTHSHQHPHEHRHEGGVQGGIIISIGHDRHSDREGLFHAEILPIRHETLSFSLSVENPERQLEPYSPGQDELLAYASLANSDSSEDQDTATEEIRFTASNSERTLFEAAIPEKFRGFESLSVVVANMELDGELHSFRFVAKAASQGDTPSTSEVLVDAGE